MSQPQYDADKESALGAIIGWGVLGIFAIGFAWYVGAPLIMGERWAQKNDQAQGGLQGLRWGHQGVVASYSIH